MTDRPVTAALVLAAGSAVRFGEQKLLAPLGDKPLIRWAVENALASRADRVLVVVGGKGEEVRKAVEELPVVVVPNPAHREGLGSSIRAGVEALAGDVGRVLVLLGDQPYVGPELMNRVMEAERADRPVTVPVYRGRQGNPVLFHASVFHELLELNGDRGGRAVVERDPARVTRLALDLPMPRDVDTREDYDRLRARAGDAG